MAASLGLPLNFKVGVDNAIFSVDPAQNRLLVLLVMRESEPFLGQ